jgi:hypothetical protein
MRCPRREQGHLKFQRREFLLYLYTREGKTPFQHVNPHCVPAEKGDSVAAIYCITRLLKKE